MDNKGFFRLSQISSRVLAFAFSSIFLISPFLVDVKITRPKLMFMELALLAVFSARLASEFASGRVRIFKNRTFAPVAVYCLAAVAFFAFSPNRALSLPELKRVLFFGAAFWLGADLIAGDKKNLLVFLWCFAAGTLWASVYGVLQKSGGAWILAVPRLDRVFSTFGNPIFFGVYLTASLPVAAAALSSDEYPPALRAVCAAALAFGAAALYFTATRASWLAAAFAAAIYVALADVPARRKIALLAVAVAAGAGFLYLTRHVWARHQAHGLIWRDTLGMWAAHPVFGVGQGLFHVKFPDYASAELLAIWPQSRAIVNDAHNEFVQTLAETGIAGFSLFAWVFAAFFASVAGRLRRAREGEALRVGIFASVAAVLAQNFFSVDMRFAISGIYVFALMGVASGEEKTVVGVKSSAARILLAAAVVIGSYFAFSAVMSPYAAARREGSRPDFFDERVLDAAATISELDALAAKYPDNASVREKLGWVYAKEKKFDAAVANYKKAIDLAPSRPGPYNNIGNIYFLTNRMDDAVAYYEKSIDAEPNQIDSRINLALAHYYRGRLGPAADQLKEVLRRDPSNEKAAILMKRMKE